MARLLPVPAGSYPWSKRAHPRAAWLCLALALPASGVANVVGGAPDASAARAALLDSARQAAAVALQAPPAAVLLREPDTRLQPPGCPGGYAARSAPGTAGAGRITVEVSCPGLAWRTFIPARIEGDAAPTPVGVPARPGNRLPLAVKRNTPVTLSAGSAAFRVVADGVALGDGAVGAWVRVRNLASGRELEGRVVGDGLVSVDPGMPTMQGIPQVAAEAVDNTSVGQVARRGDDK